MEKHGRDTITLSGKGFEEFTLPGKVIADEGGFELIIPYTVSPIDPAVTENIGGGDYNSMKQEKTPSVEGKSYKFVLDGYATPHAPPRITISRNNAKIVTFMAAFFFCNQKSVGIVVPRDKAGR